MIVGKILGAFFGYLVTDSLAGALFGVLLGHLFDRALRARLRDPSPGVRRPSGSGAPFGGGAPFGAIDRRAASEAFFDATFGVMGHVAKADGRVDESEIALAESLMTRMRLDAQRRRDAIARFTDGKSSDFSLERAVGRLREAAPGQTALYVAFLEIQVQAAMADGDFDAAEEGVLLDVAASLGVPPLVFRQIEMIARFSRRRSGRAAGDGANGSRPVGRAVPTLEDAFAVLGVPPTSDRETTKAAWRRQIGEHHPDKLVAKGLPEEMIEEATDRAQTIQKAWDTIREAKGWR